MHLDHQPKLPVAPRPICIVGAGGIVRDAHLPAYQLAGFEVAGICDLQRERATELAAKFRIKKVCADTRELVAAAPPNAVFDLAIHPASIAATLALLPDGAVVQIQKPMGESLAQAQEILAVCRRKKLVASVNLQLRYAPFVLAARSLIAQGLLGEIYDMEIRLTAHTPWDHFPSVMHEPRLEILYHSIHHVDLVRSFLGNPQSVSAKTLKHPAKKLSSTRSTILFDYGDTVHAVVNTNHDHEFGAAQQESFIKWEGTRGAIKAKMGLLMNYPDGVPDQFEFCLLTPGQPPVWREEKLAGTWFPHGFIGTMGALQRYAEGSETTLPASVEDVVHTMAVVDAAYASSARGGVKLGS
jgi:predicted dehydrogenase